MKLRVITPIAAITLLMSGCSLSPNPDTEQHTSKSSDHSLQELCDFPKQFFSARYNTRELEVSLGATRPMTEKIGGGNGCFYDTPDGEFVGYASLFRADLDATPPTTKNSLVRALTVDGVTVTETVEPISEPLDPATTRPRYKLTASIGGWDGELEFKNGDDQGTRDGAQVLVNMIRALKG
ncbi:hypothetical protein [Nocardia pneumoniae]|uniref:hypothetical protein n=1 Tax=Nocardia pneumoniae TaxID=228601 RepID=UPI0012F6268A|nr:hypothetical protein [Nocardia pneumoniae]